MVVVVVVIVVVVVACVGAGAAADLSAQERGRVLPEQPHILRSVRVGNPKLDGRDQRGEGPAVATRPVDLGAEEAVVTVCRRASHRVVRQRVGETQDPSSGEGRGGKGE